MEALRADINIKELIPEIIQMGSINRIARSERLEKMPAQREEEKIVFSEGDIKRMNYKWLD
jgi:hypothetical protein